MGWMARMNAAQQQRQRDERADLRANLADRMKMDVRLARAERRDRRAAVANGEIDQGEIAREGLGEWVHVALCFATAGLWLPVLVYVLIRNQRRNQRTSVARNATTRRAEAMAQLKERERARAKATHDRTRAARRGGVAPPQPYTPAPTPELPPMRQRRQDRNQ